MTLYARVPKLLELCLKRDVQIHGCIPTETKRSLLDITEAEIHFQHF